MSPTPATPHRPIQRLTPDQDRNDPSPARLGLSIEEFAERVGISRTSAYLAAQRGEIPTRRIGRRLIVPVAALEAWFCQPDNVAG